MELIVTIIHLTVAVFMILVVLVQGGNSGGVGAAFGGGNSSGVFGATGATSFFGKLTYGAAAVFMITSLALTKLQGVKGNIGLGEDLKKIATETEKKPDEVKPAEAGVPVSEGDKSEVPAGTEEKKSEEVVSPPAEEGKTQ